MVYLFVGAGQAGCSIVDRIFERSGIRAEATPIALNSTVRDLENLSNIADQRWIGISETDGFVSGTEAGFEELVTGGFGRQPQHADRVMQDHQGDLEQMLDREINLQENVPFAFIFLGLGGGTGCGIAPHVVDEVRNYARGDSKVIAIAVLPNTQTPVTIEDETISATRQASNALYGLDRLEDVVDGIILVDNQRLAHRDAAEGQFSEFNKYIAGSITDLVAGPIIEDIDPGQYEDVDAPVIDIQDIVTSLTRNDGGVGYGSIGRTVEMTKTLPGYFLPFIGNRKIDATEIAAVARAKQTVEDIDLTQAESAIGHVRAPRGYISEGKYQVGVSEIRRQLERTCEEVNIGMTFTERNLVSCTTVYTFKRDDLGRISELETIADADDAAPEAAPA